MKKKCKICKKLLNLKKNYGRQFNKKTQKFYITPACKECIAKRQRRYQKMPNNIATREKFSAKGFYGWNIKLERELTRTNHRLQSLEFRSDWEKKCDNLGEISKRDQKYLYKRTSNFLTQKEKDKKIINTEINRLKYRNSKISESKIITELFFGRPLMAETLIYTKEYQSIWQQRVDKLVINHSRSIKYRGV